MEKTNRGQALLLQEAAVIAEIIHGKGYLVFNDVMTVQEVADFKEGQLKLEMESPHTSRIIGAYGGRRNLDIFQSAICRAPVMNEFVQRLACLLVGPEPILCSYQTHTIPPGAQGMGPHRDYPYFSLPDGTEVGAFPLLSLQMIWALDDFREQNAPTMVQANSQQRIQKIDREEFANTACPLLLRAGSLVVSHGALCHGVSPNHSGVSRVALLASFTPYWVRPLQPNIGLGSKDVQVVKGLLGLDFFDRLRRATAPFT